MLLRKRKTSKRQNVTHRRTRVESLESRLCLSGCDISGTVYDARFSVGEQPLAGVHLFVDLNDNDIFDAGDPWTISDGNGDYLFQGLEPASYPAEYTVYETVPEGYTLTTPAVGYHTVTFNQEGSAAEKDFGNTPNSAKVDIFALGDDMGSFGISNQDGMKGLGVVSRTWSCISGTWSRQDGLPIPFCRPGARTVVPRQAGCIATPRPQQSSPRSVSGTSCFSATF